MNNILLNNVFICVCAICVLVPEMTSAAFHNKSFQDYAGFDLNIQCQFVCETSAQGTIENACKTGCNFFNPVTYINEPAVIKMEEECETACEEIFFMDELYNKSCTEGCTFAAQINHKINFERVVEDCVAISVASIVFPEVHFVFKRPANVTYQYRNFTCHKFLPANYSPRFWVLLFLLVFYVFVLVYCTIFLLKLLDRFKNINLPRYEATVPSGG